MEHKKSLAMFGRDAALPWKRSGIGASAPTFTESANLLYK